MPLRWASHIGAVVFSTSGSSRAKEQERHMIAGPSDAALILVYFCKCPKGGRLQRRDASADGGVSGGSEASSRETAWAADEESAIDEA